MSESRPTVFIHARPLRTGGGPAWDAFLVRDGMFAAFGEGATLVRDAVGVAVVDLEGALVAPAFLDAHTHLSAGSLELAGVDLRGAATRAETLDRVARHAASLPADAWVRGFGWDATAWPDGPPEADLAGAAAGARPVWLARADGHAAWTADRGVVEDEQFETLRRTLPAFSAAERRDAVLRGLALAARHGLAGFADIVEPWAPAIYSDLRDEGRLHGRVDLWLPLELDREEAEHWRRVFPPDDPWLSAGTLKVFLDGTLGGRSAALRAAYEDAPGRTGTLRIDPGDLAESVRDAHESGWAVAFHAVGDLAVRTALDALEGLPRRPGARAHRIEHAQCVAIDDLPRFARLGVAASVQPAQWIDDRRWIRRRLGRHPERDRRAVVHPWRSLAASGALLAFGSDWPVSSIDPLDAVAAATDAARDERLEEGAAIEAATSGVARARGRPEGWGRLDPGAPADFLAYAAEGGGWSAQPALWLAGQATGPPDAKLRAPL